MLIGFLTGVGIQVAMGQVGGMLGIARSAVGRRTVEKFVTTLGDIGQTQHGHRLRVGRGASP